MHTWRSADSGYHGVALGVALEHHVVRAGQVRFMAPGYARKWPWKRTAAVRVFARGTTYQDCGGSPCSTEDMSLRMIVALVLKQLKRPWVWS